MKFKPPGTMPKIGDWIVCTSETKLQVKKSPHQVTHINPLKAGETGYDIFTGDIAWGSEGFEDPPRNFGFLKTPTYRVLEDK